MPNPDTKEAPSEPAMGAITDRQLLVDVAQKLGVLMTTTKEGFEASASRDLELVQRVTALESWKLTADDRLNRNSARASEPSQHDLDAQAALAAEVEARKKLEAKVDTIDKKQDVQTAIMTRVESAAVTWWSSPAGKIVRYVAYGAAIGWLAKNNIHIPGVN